jgi:hypothetical protein
MPVDDGRTGAPEAAPCNDHLHAPPRGCQRVQVGGDYVLVAVASGIIAQLIVNGS